ncbi:MAG: hypothetical protein VCC01_14290 [Candidatus Hydrogenedentota bacterium]
MSNSVADFYRGNPRMVSSPFGGGLSMASQTPFIRKLGRFHGDAGLSPMESFRRRE